MPVHQPAALLADGRPKPRRLSRLSTSSNPGLNPSPICAAAPTLQPGLLRWALPVTLAVQSASAAAVIAPAVAAPALLAALGLGTAAVGVYIAIVYLGAMVASLWGAALVQRWGPIRVSQAGLALSAMGLGLMVLPQVGAAALGALLLGLGYGPITPASSQMLARTTPPERYGLVFSVKQTGVPLGGVLAGLMVPPVLLMAGAAAALALVAGMCLLSLLLAQGLRGVLDSQRAAGGALPGWAQLLQPLQLVRSHPVLRRLAACTFVFSLVQLSLSAYLVSFLTTDLGWGLVRAGVALSVAQAAGVVGRILWGWVADRWQGGPRLTLLGLAAAMGLAGLLMPLLTAGTSGVWVMLLLATYGATAIGWNGVFLGTVAKLVPTVQAAAATGGCLFFTFFGVVIGPPIFGLAASGFGRVGPAFALLALPLGAVLWALARGRWTATLRSAAPA